MHFFEVSTKNILEELPRCFVINCYTINYMKWGL